MKTWLIFLTILSIILFSVAFAYPQLEKFEQFRISKTFYQGGIEKASTDLNPDSLLDSFIKETMSEYNIPGVSTCIVKDGQIIWDKSYGYANIEQNKKVTNGTVFLLASISKTVTAKKRGASGTFPGWQRRFRMNSGCTPWHATSPSARQRKRSCRITSSD